MMTTKNRSSACARLMLALIVSLSLAWTSAATAQDAPAGAVHGGQAPAPAPASAPGAMPQRKAFKLNVKVNKRGDGGAETPAAGVAVLLDAMAGDMKIRSYNAKTNEQGVATFDLVGVMGARYVPKVVHEGINFTGQAVTPSQDVHDATIVLFDKTFDDKGLLVTDMMTTVDLWEGYLVFTQMWTFVNTGPTAFDPTGSTDEKYAEGLPIVLPKKAQGINAMVMRGGGVTEQARVFENKVFVTAPVPPMVEGSEPLRVQLRYSMTLKDSFFEYEQPLDYAVEGMRVVVPLQTRFKKHPSLSLTLNAPGFPDIGDGRRMPGMNPNMKFVVARDGTAEPGSKLYFTVDGYPVHDPPGRWIALGLVVLALLGGFMLFARESKGKGGQGRGARKLKIRALTDEREDLFDALRDLDERYEDGELSDRRYDIEAARLRERLALVLRRLEQERTS